MTDRAWLFLWWLFGAVAAVSAVLACIDLVLGRTDLAAQSGVSCMVALLCLLVLEQWDV